jgi:hypothetical protein
MGSVLGSDSGVGLYFRYFQEGPQVHLGAQTPSLSSEILVLFLHFLQTNVRSKFNLHTDQESFYAYLSKFFLQNRLSFQCPLLSVFSS